MFHFDTAKIQLKRAQFLLPWQAELISAFRRYGFRAASFARTLLVAAGASAGSGSR